MQLEVQQLLFNDKMCHVLKIHEISALRKINQLEIEQKFQQLYQTTVSHQMLTPMKNINLVSKDLLKARKSKKTEDSKRKL